MERKVIVTADGSTTIHLREWGEQYHSKHGAIQEAYHVFLNHGLLALEQSEVSILEMGLGTGLNVLITYCEAQKRGLAIDYVGVEAFPVPPEELSQLNYVSALGHNGLAAVFEKIHTLDWEQPVELSPLFKLWKQQKGFFEVADKGLYDLVYFDAFGPRVQPELWTIGMMKKMFSALKPNGILVTYSAKGSVRRNLQEAGFAVERLSGPPGKREMLRARKG